MSAFYDQLVVLLRKLILTRTQFLKDIGMNRNQMSLWKKGATPRPTTLSKIDKYFDVPVGYFRSETDENGNPIKTWEEKHTNVNPSTEVFAAQLFSMFNSTTDVGRMRIIQAVLNICEEEKKASTQDTDVISRIAVIRNSSLSMATKSA